MMPRGSLLCVGFAWSRKVDILRLLRPCYMTVLPPACDIQEHGCGKRTILGLKNVNDDLWLLVDRTIGCLERSPDIYVYLCIHTHAWYMIYLCSIWVVFTATQLQLHVSCSSAGDEAWTPPSWPARLPHSSSMGQIKESQINFLWCCSLSMICPLWNSLTFNLHFEILRGGTRWDL